MVTLMTNISDDRLDVSGISKDLSRDIAKIYWESKIKITNPSAGDYEKKLLWEQEKAQNRDIMRHALRVMKLKGINFSR